MAVTLVKSPNKYNYSEDPMFFTLETDKLSGVPPYQETEDNLSCYVEVWEKGLNGNTDRLLGKLNTKFSRWTKRADFNVSSMIGFSPGLPTFSQFGFASSGVAEGRIRAIYIKYAEVYGTPAEVQSLQQTQDHYYLLPGSSKQTIGIPTRGGFALQDTTSTREVGFNQPDWTYFLLETGGTITVDVVFTKNDGTTVNNQFTKTASGSDPLVYYLASGPGQIPTPAGLQWSDISSYTLSIKVTAQPLMIKRYIVDTKMVDNERFILCDTGLGGYETVRMKGGMKVDISGSLKSYRRNDYSVISDKDGVSDVYDINQYRSYTFYSGYYNKAYIEYIGSIIPGRAWLIESLFSAKNLVLMVSGSVSVKNIKDDNRDIHFVQASYIDSRVKKKV